MPTVNHEKLRKLVAAIVQGAGSTGDEPRIVADNLVDANLAGHDSHGVGMLPRYVECVITGELRPNQSAEVVSDQGAIVVIKGNAGYGQVIGREAMALGIEKAREHGVCVMTIRESFHLCRIGAWAEQCAQAGLVSMHHVNLQGHPGLVAPFRGRDARYSTNPYCCALPATKRNPPTVLDMATSIIAQGKVRVAKNKGEQLAEGILLDGKGDATRDPNAMFTQPRGAILPFGEHKGYGLAILNELLAGVLSGGGTCRPETDHENDTILNNMLSIIIDPTRLIDTNYYDTEVDATIAHVKASPPRNPDEPVLVPGDPERHTRANRQNLGVPIDDETWSELARAAHVVGLPEGEVERLCPAIS